MTDMESDIAQRPLSEVPVAVVDVETTGLSPRYGDRICEIAVIRREPDGSVRRFVSFVDPQRPISAGAFAVNGITPDMLEGAPRFCAIMPELDETLSDAVFIAHNAPFDLGFVQSEYAQCSREFRVPAVIDTRLVSKRYLNLSSNSLASVARHLHIPQPNAHRAMADCETTLRVFDAIVEQAQLAHRQLNEIVSAPRVVAERQVVPVLPDGLSDLIRREGEVEIVYLTANGSRTRRSIREIQISQYGEHLYLRGHCSLRNAERQFRLDRIVQWSPVGGAKRWPDNGGEGAL
ncbi:MAG: WYL domain-containing protein [candidate division Zixibacteria bacterium]|nr:WYL domain-containing protein [candidate division Zixibacteria bacterium]